MEVSRASQYSQEKEGGNLLAKDTASQPDLIANLPTGSSIAGSLIRKIERARAYQVTPEDQELRRKALDVAAERIQRGTLARINEAQVEAGQAQWKGANGYPMPRRVEQLRRWPHQWDIRGQNGSTPSQETKPTRPVRPTTPKPIVHSDNEYEELLRADDVKPTRNASSDSEAASLGHQQHQLAVRQQAACEKAPCLLHRPRLEATQSPQEQGARGPQNHSEPAGSGAAGRSGNRELVDHQGAFVETGGVFPSDLEVEIESDPSLTSDDEMDEVNDDPQMYYFDFAGAYRIITNLSFWAVVVAMLVPLLKGPPTTHAEVMGMTNPYELDHPILESGFFEPPTIKTEHLTDEKPEERARAIDVERVLTAYDCSQPRKLEDRALDELKMNCDDMEEQRLSNKRNVTFQLLVKEKKRRIRGHKCTLLDTRRVRYCGNYDHQTHFSKYDQFDIPRLLTPTECRDIIRTGVYIQPDGIDETVKVGERLFGQYYEAGTEYGDANEIQCEGEDWKIGGSKYSDMIVQHNYQLTVVEEEFLWDEHELITMSDSKRVHCAASARECRNGDETYVWDYSNAWCHMAVAKRVQGILVEAEGGERVFMSDDGNNVRLVLGSEQSECGKLITTTNYPDLFLAYEDRTIVFSRMVDASSISISTYVANRDDYLYNHIIGQINNELSATLADNCKKRMVKTRQDYFSHHKTPGIITYGYGNGTFATSAGEVMYYYRCRQELVSAIEDPKGQCYDALPVILHYKSPLKQRFNASTQWYVEPLTRRLTRFSSPVPCTQKFAAKYKMRHGNWIQITPTLHDTKTPRLVTSQEEHFRKIIPDQDFSRGGVFSADDLKEWEAYAFSGRIENAVTSRLAKSVTNEYKHGSGSPLFQTPESWFVNKMKEVFSFLDYWGKGAAIFFSLLTIWQLVAKVLSILYGGKQIYRHLGRCSWQIFWAMCPGFLLLRNHGNAHHYEEPEDPRRESPEQPRRKFWPSEKKKKKRDRDTYYAMRPLRRAQSESDMEEASGVFRPLGGGVPSEVNPQYDQYLSMQTNPIIRPSTSKVLTPPHNPYQYQTPAHGLQQQWRKGMRAMPKPDTGSQKSLYLSQEQLHEAVGMPSAPPRAGDDSAAAGSVRFNPIDAHSVSARLRGVQNEHASK